MAVIYRAVGTAATGTTSVTCSQPSGTSSGDLLLAFIVDHATSGSSSAPTGWTRVGGAAGTGGRFQVFKAQKSAVSGTSWSFSGLTTRSEGVILGCYSSTAGNGVDIDQVSARINASGTTGTTSITTTSDGELVIGAFAALASGATWSAETTATLGALTERSDNANSTYCSIATATATQTTAGVVGASSATMSTAGANGAILLSVFEAPTFQYAGAGNVSASGEADTSYTFNYSYGDAKVGTWSFVRSGGSGSVSGTKVTGSLSAKPTAGNLVVVCIHYSHSSSTVAPTLLSVKDSAGNLYTLVPDATADGTSYAGHNSIDYLAYLLNAPSTATASITATFDSSPTSGDVYGVEFKPTDPANFVTANGAVGTTSNSVTGVSITAPLGSLLISFLDYTGAASPWVDAGANSYPTDAEYILSSTLSTTDVKWNPGPGYYEVSNIAFIALSSPDGIPITISGEATTSYTTDAVSSFSYSGSGSVYVYGAAQCAETSYYSYSGSGNLTATGTAATWRTSNYQYSGSGSVTTVGAATALQSQNYWYSGAGSVAVSGSASRSVGVSFSGAVTVVQSGAATAAATANFAYTSSGSVTSTGSSTNSVGFAFSGSGSVAALGTSTTTAFAYFQYVGTGTVSQFGAATASNTSTSAYSGSGAVTVSTATTYSYTARYQYNGGMLVLVAGSAPHTLGLQSSGSGSLTIAGSAATSTTSSFYYSASGSVSITGTSETRAATEFAYSGTGSVSVAGTASYAVNTGYSYTTNLTASISGAATYAQTAYYVASASGSVSVAGSAVSALVLSYSGSGDITATCTSSHAIGLTYFSTGELVVRGGAASSPGFGYTTSGSLTASGSGTTSQTANYSAVGSGSVSIYGSSTAGTVADISYNAVGSISIAGSAAYGIWLTRTASGAVSIAGGCTSTSQRFYACTGSLKVVVSGGSTTELHYTFAGDGALELEGTARYLAVEYRELSLDKNFAITIHGRTYELPAAKTETLMVPARAYSLTVENRATTIKPPARNYEVTL